MRIPNLAPFAASLIVLAVAAGCTSGDDSSTATGQCASVSTCNDGVLVSQCVVTDSSGSCASEYITVGASRFNCNACSDCTQAQSQANAICLAMDAGADAF